MRNAACETTDIRSGRKKLPVSVIMLTLNEEHHLPGAIENVRDWVEDIFIVDSLSTDRTVDIALEHGVTVIQRPFTNFGDQWNFALENLPIRTPWTIKLDPDERISEDLWEQIAGVMEQYRYDGFIMPLRLWFMGRPLHVKMDIMRLWRTGRCRFSDVIVNEHPLVAGELGHLNGWMEHLDCPNLHHWFEKQNRYSTLEAISRVKSHSLAVRPRLWGTKMQRRMFLKKYIFNMPLRYQLLWLYYYFYRGAWRDGVEGRAWAHLRVEIMRTRQFKTREMQTTGRIPELPRTRVGEYDPRILEQPLQREIMRRDNDRRLCSPLPVQTSKQLQQKVSFSDVGS